MRTMSIIILSAALATPVAALSITKVMADSAEQSQQIAGKKATGHFKHKKSSGGVPLFDKRLDTQIG